MSYNKLWELLIGKGMTRPEMRKQAGGSVHLLSRNSEKVKM